MTISSKGIDFIKSFEKCKLTAYKNGNEPWTIGWGNTRYRNGKPVKQGDVITQKEADELFTYWLLIFSGDVEKLVTSKVNQGQFDMLTSFAYNCGSDIDSDNIAEGLGDSTLLKLVNKNPNDPAIAKEFMKWVSKDTEFENGLIIRRAGEVTCYFSRF